MNRWKIKEWMKKKKYARKLAAASVSSVGAERFSKLNMRSSEWYYTIHAFNSTLKYIPKLSKQVDLLLEKDFLPIEFFMISEVGEQLFTSCVFTSAPLQALSNVPTIVPNSILSWIRVNFIWCTQIPANRSGLSIRYSCDPLDIDTNCAKNLSHSVGTFQDASV